MVVPFAGSGAGNHSDADPVALALVPHGGNLNNSGAGLELVVLDNLNTQL